MRRVTRDEWTDALHDDEAHEARQAFVRTTSDAVASAGQALSFLPPADAVQGLAVVTQMGGALASGACVLLDAENAYSASALVRQLVEIEYLWSAFADDPDEAARWLRASKSQHEGRFRPAKLRERSGGRFRRGEYQSHCVRGGHPNPAGAVLLPDPYGLSGARFDPVRMAWADLAQHLERGWDFLLEACNGVDRLGAVERDAPKVREGWEGWRACDPLSPRIAPVESAA